MEIQVLPANQWAQTVADRWVERLAAAPDLVMCVPTGSTPRPVYAAMAAAVRGGEVSFADATVFLLDEFGGLPPGDPGRCDFMIRRDFLDHIDLPNERLQRLNPDVDDLDHEVARYWAAVMATGLDLTMVGLGMNGHVGLNEPGSTTEMTTRRVDLQADTMKSMARYGGDHAASWGLTLGLSEILSSRELWMLAAGESKARIVREVLEGPTTPDRPASLLRAHPNYLVMLDEAAAGELSL